MRQNSIDVTTNLPTDLLLRAYRLMCTSRKMACMYEKNREICDKYVHSTSMGHEAIQLAVGMQIEPHDFLSPYYRDESLLLALGLSPLALMQQLMSKRDDPFSGGRSYYGHPSLRRNGYPTIPHQSSATGMQAIPATGMAHGLAYMRSQGLLDAYNQSVVVCSMGDAAVTEGEVSEALQMAVLKKLSIIYLIQDNGWGISATSQEMRAMDAYAYAAGFKGLKRMRSDGSSFETCYHVVEQAFAYVRTKRSPLLLHVKCPLLGHHTSGVRKESYRGNNLASHQKKDPLLKLKQNLLNRKVQEEHLFSVRKEAEQAIEQAFWQVQKSANPIAQDFDKHVFAPSFIEKEQGVRMPENSEKVTMVDAALHALEDILKKHPESLFYGQDVGSRLGGVFREAAMLANKYGDNRVFNMPIQEAYIVGSTAGMNTVGAKPIVEVQFADYLWPAFNQLVGEIAKSCYLTIGKFPLQILIRVPVGAYGSGGPYHSASIESTLLNIRGIKVVYPSNAADMKGLFKSSFYDPNPVVLMEHKGLYWSKLPNTNAAKTIEPDEDYIIPLGQARIVLEASFKNVREGQSIVVITYGMGVHWAVEASKLLGGDYVEVLDLRTLAPLDWVTVKSTVKKHGRAFVLTEEPLLNSFAESLAGRIAKDCYLYLDAPVWTYGAADVPAIPLNTKLEQCVLPNPKKVKEELSKALSF